VTLVAHCKVKIISPIVIRWPSCSWSYGSWIYNHLCNQCLYH